MSPLEEVAVLRRERVHPQTPQPEERALLLSLLDATTANFALTNAIWLFERPAAMAVRAVPDHLRQTLGATLDAYPQWCGRLEAVAAVTPDQLPAAAKGFPTHGRRYGRVYARFGGGAEGGVDFATATSSLTLDALHARARPTAQPLWDRSDDGLARFANDCAIAQALQPGDGGSGAPAAAPLVGIQCTTLACGGVVLAAKVAHPLADISGLVYFVRDWARVSRAAVAGGGGGGSVPRSPGLCPVFAPDRLDAVAAGDINGPQADPAIVRQAAALPLHRYDWWAAPGKPPEALRDDPAALAPAGLPMPWAEWDTAAPVAGYTIHLTREQVAFLWERATADSDGGDANSSSGRISKHDAVLAHVFSCVMRARQLAADAGPVHCDLVLGLRAGLQLGDAFMGSPVLMLDIALPGTAACRAAPGAPTGVLAPVAQKVRAALAVVGRRDSVAAHLHTLAFERAPQRLWQAFLGRRHILVTTWARAGLYAVDFGLGAAVRYADGLVPRLDGIVLIKEAPPASAGFVPAERPSWIADGVDVTVNLRAEDMERLLQDPLLLPKCS